VAQLLVAPGTANPLSLTRQFNSIDNLSGSDPYIRITADLPLSPRVRYHSIIGNNTPQLPLAESSDGVVPYASAHLPGADSEKVIRSGHSVQETHEAILEIRRIMHKHLDELAGGIPQVETDRTGQSDGQPSLQGSGEGMVSARNDVQRPGGGQVREAVHRMDPF
jgi:hypothetical protein